ncbi:MAG: hypothetical protein K8S20_12910 [Chloroflexi bacterium]|nr:hypothetical protein [Chloroflexota bacterium]
MKLQDSRIRYLPFLFVLITNACGPAPATVSPSTATEPAAQVPQAGVIVHIATPGTGSTQEASAHDNDESNSFQDKDVQSGDQFKVNRFERPFTSKDMKYLPYVDIKNMVMKSDDTWFYIDIELVGLGKGNNLPKGSYGAEFDLNMDGRAEYLILAKPPFSEAWSTDGLALYFDQNGDIGGTRMYPDDTYTGNGYETVLVDSGAGPDPDVVWARYVNSSKPIIELAVKRDLFEDTSTFMWDVLASANPVDPTKLYFNDTLTAKRAGSPRKQLKNFYPINELWGFDNTCRVPFGFQATGNEPMGCSVAQEDPSDVEFGAPAPPKVPRICADINCH